MKIPEEKRLAVKEVTMDYSDSMYSIVTQVFPNASIVIDCFHVMKNQCDALDCIRMRFKRKAIAEQNKEKKEFNRKKRERKAARARYRKSHPKKRARNVEGQESVPTRNMCLPNCPMVTLRWNSLLCKEGSSPKR